MKKTVLLSLSLAVMLVGGTALAADQAQDPYSVFQQKVAPLQQQLYAKQAELSAEYAATAPNMEKVRQLYQEMGNIQAQLFAARSELRNNDNQGGNWGGYGGGYCGGYCGDYAGGGYGRGYGRRGGMGGPMMGGGYGGCGGGYGRGRGGCGW